MNFSANRAKTRVRQPVWKTASPPLLLDLYGAEVLAQVPGALSLRKLWAPFEPGGRCVPGTRGYYVVQKCNGRIRYLRFNPKNSPWLAAGSARWGFI